MLAMPYVNIKTQTLTRYTGNVGKENQEFVFSFINLAWANAWMVFPFSKTGV